MAKMKDITSEAMEGYFHCLKTFKDGHTEKFVIKNLVVSKAREVVRNLVFGDSETITSLVLGNANVLPENALKASKIPTPNIADVRLENQLFTANITNKEKVTYEDRPAIKFSFYLDFNEGNGDGSDTQGFFTEAGLALADGTLFTRLTFKALTKTKESNLAIDYYLLF